MTVAILAGGLGTRLQSMFPDKPKVLANILGRPFVSYLLDQLLAAGARDVVFCTGYKANDVYRELGISYQSLQLTYSKEKVPLGTGGALRLALPYLRSDPILVMNGDSFIDVDIDAYLEWFSKKKRLASILLKNVPDTGRYGRVVFDSNGIITSFEEKGSNIGVGWINAGIYILQKSLIADMPSTKPFSLEHDFFPKLVGHGLYGYCSNGDFIDIGTPETYAQAENFFKERYF